MSLLPFAIDAGRFLLNNFSQRGRRSSRGRSRRGRRRTGGTRRSQAGVSNRVPTRSVMQGSFTGSIRNYYTVPSNTGYYHSITRDELLGDQFVSLKTQFGECRIISVRAYFQPDQSTDTAGLYASCLIDQDHSKAGNLSYGQILALPGSTSRKVYQSVGHHWKWTEPSDANFRKTNDKDDGVCEFFLRTNTDSVKVSGDLVVDASIVLRSIPSSFGEQTHLMRMLHIHPWTPDQLIEASQAIDELLAATNLPLDEERSTCSSSHSASRIPVPVRKPRRNASLSEQCSHLSLSPQ